MKHFIDPTIDYVFKRLLASSGHEKVLIDFLNSLINPATPIVTVEVLNPFNEREYSEDKLSIVDIKVTDDLGKFYQIEVQLTSPYYLTKRMLFTWSEVYTRQMGEGDDFDKLKPTISIWLLTNSLFKNTAHCHHHFQLWDKQRALLFSDQCAIHVFELNKWHKPRELQQADNWLYFFKEAKRWKQLPKELKAHKVMRQAMATLKNISDQKADYFKYCKRQDSIRVHLSDIAAKARAEADAAEQTKLRIAAEAKAQQIEVAAQEQKVQDQLKIADLMAKLKQAGIDTD